MSSAAVVLFDDSGDENSEVDGEGDEDDGNNGGSVRGAGEKRKIKRQIVNHAALFEGEMDRLGALLREGDESQRVVDERKIDLDEHRLDF